MSPRGDHGEKGRHEVSEKRGPSEAERVPAGHRRRTTQAENGAETGATEAKTSGVAAETRIVEAGTGAGEAETPGAGEAEPWVGATAEAPTGRYGTAETEAEAAQQENRATETRTGTGAAEAEHGAAKAEAEAGTTPQAAVGRHGTAEDATRAAATETGVKAAPGAVAEAMPEASPEALAGAVGAAAEGDAAHAPAGVPTTPESRAANGTHGLAPDERAAALRRFVGAERRWRMGRLAGSVVLSAVALTGAAVAVGAGERSGTAAVAVSQGVEPGQLAGGDLDAGIAALQAHLRGQPRDHADWATLGLAYVEQARTKGDPSRYPQAEQALKRSLRLAPGDDQALAGLAALAAARHDFKGALTYADRALQRNPYSERALCSRIDALVELGRYSEASKAADLADTRRPGVPVFTRYAYVHELRGDVNTARRVLEQALTTATSRGDIAYVATQLGQLAWNQGEYKTALGHYARALAADENYLPALEGRARAQFASGDRAGAVGNMELVVSRYPLPGPLVELGELYEDRGRTGDRTRARDQYALVDAWTALARANGVNADLDTALAAADHGDKAAALRAARAEWARRHTVHTADALAWALHVNGHDAEALPYARRATATGYRNAAFLYHRGTIELATGHRADGRASLTAALRLNPGFSPLGARAARTELEAAK